MVRSKLITNLQQEINHYLGIPYAKNYWQKLVLKKEAIFAGKGNWQEIDYATKCAAEKSKINYQFLTEDQKYNFRKKYHIGIDCSGLCYHLLNFLDQKNGHSGILFKMVGIDKPYGIYGVRSLSAKEMTHPKNSFPIATYNQINTGDLIRFDSGHHLIFIISKTKEIINYVHSSDHTKTRGVHQGYIKIINPGSTLDQQLWSDSTLSGKPYNQLFFPQNGDGIFRPFFLT